MLIGRSVVLFYGISTLFESFNTELNFRQFSLVRIVFVYKQLNVKTVLFQTIQLSISTQFSSIWPIDKALSGATTPGRSGLGSDVNEQVLRIPQSSTITRTSPSNCLVLYPGHLLGGVLGLTPPQKSSVFYSPSWLDKKSMLSWKYWLYIHSWEEITFLTSYFSK